MRRIRILFVIASTTGALVSVAAMPASAATQRSLYLSTSSKSVHTSKGTSVHLALSANKDTTQGATTPTQLSLSLTNGLAYLRGETHSWGFSLSRSSLTYTGKTGKGSLTTGKQIAPFGTMSLTFNKTGGATTKCTQSGSTTSVRGRLHGSFHFNSGTGWGNVGSANFAFPTPTFLSIDNGCVNKPTNVVFPCGKYNSWSGPSVTAGNATTSPSGYTTFNASSTTSSIKVTRSVLLTKPSGANRQDILVATARANTINGNTLTVHPKSGTPVHGTGKVTAPGGTPATSKCGHHKTEKTVFHSSGQWVSKSGSPLTFNFSAVPDAVVPTSGIGNWYQATFS